MNDARAASDRKLPNYFQNNSFVPVVPSAGRTLRLDIAPEVATPYYSIKGNSPKVAHPWHGGIRAC